jgi:hypothetical protein
VVLTVLFLLSKFVNFYKIATRTLHRVTSTLVLVKDGQEEELKNNLSLTIKGANEFAVKSAGGVCHESIV